MTDNTHFAGRLGSRRARTLSIAVPVACTSLLAFTSFAHAVPPDPERRNASRTCREALTRVREAATGNPLVDSTRQRQILLDALTVAERLCLPRKK